MAVVLSARAETATDALDALMASAEASLRDGEVQQAESRYRSALLEGWLLIGSVAQSDGRSNDALAAFEHAHTSSVETARPARRLALIRLQQRDTDVAVGLLSRELARDPRDRETRVLLAQALVASGKPGQAIQELEEGHAADPDDAELAFALAGGYLRLGKPEPAGRLFDKLLRVRPIPQTKVLVGRTYRDFKQFDRARELLEAALAQDPKVRHANYYLGMIDVTDRGASGLESAIARFRKELALAPDDQLINLRLGMALVEAQRPQEALPFLVTATNRTHPEPDAFLYLGRCQSALGRTTDAVTSLERALALMQVPPVDESRLGNTHYQLATALRKLGRNDEGARHFSAAETTSASRASQSRADLARYMSDAPDQPTASAAVAPYVATSPLDAVAPAARQAILRKANDTVARALFNLGLMQAQGGRFDRGVQHFDLAAQVLPGFPQVQRALGLSLFNTGRFAEAAMPLSKAIEAEPGDSASRRMLALSWFNSEQYAPAAELLRDDPGRETDPSLQYAYGAALVRSGNAAEAERVFERLVDGPTESAEIHVVLGQAHAAQGDYDAAVASLERALALKPDVAEANATLGVMYLKQGRLDDAEARLRAELRSHPGDLRSQQNLASALELLGKTGEAVPLLRGVLKVRPAWGDARYLLGKLLLLQGDAPEAALHLEAAARISPEDANVHYQLGKAYQKLGRGASAEEQFEIFRTLKDKKRGPTS